MRNKARRSDTSGAVSFDRTAAIILLRTDPILALGAIVADELYGRSLPVVTLDEEAFRTIREGDRVTIEPDGTVVVVDAGGA